MDVRVAPLIAAYVRGSDGAYDVLRDAFLELGLEPPPSPDDPTGADSGGRLDALLERLPKAEQLRIATSSARRLAADVGDPALQRQIHKALDALETSSAVELRGKLFKGWQTAVGADKRIVWAAWMALRGLPSSTLRTCRAIHAAELEAQIAVVAAAVAR
jgi:hypothetical protein